MRITFSSQLHYRLSRAVHLQLKKEPSAQGHSFHSMAIPQGSFPPLTVVGWGRREVQHSSPEHSLQHRYSVEMSLGEQQVSSYNLTFRRTHQISFSNFFLLQQQSEGICKEEQITRTVAGTRTTVLNDPSVYIQYAEIKIIHFLFGLCCTIQND